LQTPYVALSVHCVPTMGSIGRNRCCSLPLVYAALTLVYAVFKLLCHVPLSQLSWHIQVVHRVGWLLDQQSLTFNSQSGIYIAHRQY